MRVIQVTQTGAPDVLKLTELPDPKPGQGDALVELKAIGVNYMDVLGRSGAGRVNLPWIPGGEGAGTVIEVGPDVTEVQVGDVVVYSSAPASYAEKVVVPARRLAPVPKGLEPEVAAAVLLQGMTAHYLTHDLYPLQPGEACLVHAAAGGVGALLVQMAKIRGAEVIATVSTQAKAQVARDAGADHIVLYTEQDFEEEVKRLTNGEGVRVVFDGVGKATFEKSLASVGRRGMLVLYGQSSGAVPPVSPTILTVGSKFLTRPSLTDYTATREEFVDRATTVLTWATEGRLKVNISARFPLERAAEAHQKMEGRLTVGKLLLIP